MAENTEGSVVAVGVLEKDLTASGKSSRPAKTLTVRVPRHGEKLKT
jgi:hypothetical protein